MARRPAAAGDARALHEAAARALRLPLQHLRLLQARPAPPRGGHAAAAFPLRNSVLYGAFAWARGAPDGRRRRFPARAVVHNRSHARWQQIMTDPTYFGPDQYGEVIDDTVRAVQGRFSGIIVCLWKSIL